VQSSYNAVLLHLWILKGPSPHTQIYADTYQLQLAPEGMTEKTMRHIANML